MSGTLTATLAGHTLSASGTIVSVQLPGIVVFDYAVWSLAFPELAPFVSQPTAAGYFGQAGDLIDNTPSSLISDVGMRGRILGLLTAHYAALFSSINGAAATGLVGRITGATEGSVSVQVQGPPMSANSWWWLQTKYGAAAWNALAPYRTMRYIPGPNAYSWNTPYLPGGWPAGIY